MSGISNEVISLLQYLLPGFLVAWVVYGLTTHAKPGQFERIIQALIYSLVVDLATSLITLIINKTSVLTINKKPELFISLATALLIGLLISFLLNRDYLHAILRKTKLSKRISHPSNFHFAFSEEPTYIVLHLHDDRRAIGWPLLWPSASKDDYFRLTKCYWQDPDGNETSINHDLLICGNDVRWIELLKEKEANEIKKTAYAT